MNRCFEPPAATVATTLAARAAITVTPTDARSADATFTATHPGEPSWTSALGPDAMLGPDGTRIGPGARTHLRASAGGTRSSGRRDERSRRRSPRRRP